MKYYLLLLVSFVLVFGCTKVETNSPAMQGKLNNSLFQSKSTSATILPDSTLIIQGITAIEVLTIKLNKSRTGTYILGTGINTYATFEKDKTFFYNTNPNGDGQVILSEIDRVGKTVSGTFRFNAIAAGIDTLNFQEGVFFQVPYDGESLVDPDNQGSGTLSAKLNFNNFEALGITTYILDQTLTINGTKGNKTMILTMPIDATPGTYAVGEQEYNASYKEGTSTEIAISGSIIIVSNDLAQRKIKGTFSFETDSNVITEGNFDVIY